MTVSGTQMAPSTRPIVYHREGDALRPTAASLHELYAADSVSYEAQEALRSVDYAHELQTEDQSSLDTDRRDQHVVLPENQFESHPDSGFSLNQGRFALQGQDQKVTFSATSDDTQVASGEWDGSDAMLTVWPRQDFPTPPRYADGATNLLSEQTVTYSPGRLPEDETGKRAAEIVQSVAAWEAMAQQLDGQMADLNPSSREVVAAHLQAPAGEAAMTQTFAERGPESLQKTPFTSFDLESSQGHLLVSGSFGQGPTFGATLESNREGNLLTAVLSRPELGIVEKVEWNTSDAVLHYEKLKKG